MRTPGPLIALVAGMAAAWSCARFPMLRRMVADSGMVMAGPPCPSSTSTIVRASFGRACSPSSDSPPRAWPPGAATPEIPTTSFATVATETLSDGRSPASNRWARAPAASGPAEGAFAIALNGILAATLPFPAALEDQTAWRPFSAMLPPSLFVDGANRVELFEIRRPIAVVAPERGAGRLE